MSSRLLIDRIDDGCPGISSLVRVEALSNRRTDQHLGESKGHPRRMIDSTVAVDVAGKALVVDKMTSPWQAHLVSDPSLLS